MQKGDKVRPEIEEYKLGMEKVVSELFWGYRTSPKNVIL